MAETSFCPVCAETGNLVELTSYQLNFDEAIKMCPRPNCTYPLDGQTSMEASILQRSSSDLVVQKRKSRRSSCSSNISVLSNISTMRECNSFSNDSKGYVARPVYSKDNDVNKHFWPVTSYRARNPTLDAPVGSLPGSLYRSSQLRTSNTNGSSLTVSDNNPYSVEVPLIINRPVMSLHSPPRPAQTVSLEHELSKINSRPVTNSCLRSSYTSNHLQPEAVIATNEEKVPCTLHTNSNINFVSSPSKNTEQLKKELGQQFIQWKNADSLCWLDVALVLLVHCHSLYTLLDSTASLADTMLHQLIFNHSKAQDLYRQALEFRHCAEMARCGRSMAILSSIGKITVKTGGGSNVSKYSLSQIIDNETHACIKSEVPNDKPHSMYRLQTENINWAKTAECSDSANSVESKLDGDSSALGKKTPERLTSTGEWLMTPDELDDRATSMTQRAHKMFAHSREAVWQRLNVKLRCPKGSRDSPVFALPLLLNESPAFEALLRLRYTWSMSCVACGYQHTDPNEKVLPSFLRTEPDFTMSEPYVLRSCFRCLAPNQRLSLSYQHLPACVLAHFTHGLHHCDFTQYDFTVGCERYTVKCLVQHVTEPDHFIAWARRKTGDGRSLWMKLDDTQAAECRFTEQPPAFPPAQVYMVMWERETTQNASQQSRTEKPLTEQQQCTVHCDTSELCKYKMLSQTAGNGRDLVAETTCNGSPIQTLVVEACRDGEQRVVVDLRNHVIKPTGKRQVIKLVLKPRDPACALQNKSCVEKSNVPLQASSTMYSECQSTAEHLHCVEKQNIAENAPQTFGKVNTVSAYPEENNSDENKFNTESFLSLLFNDSAEFTAEPSVSETTHNPISEMQACKMEVTQANDDALQSKQRQGQAKSSSVGSSAGLQKKTSIKSDTKPRRKVDKSRSLDTRIVSKEYEDLTFFMLPSKPRNHSTKDHTGNTASILKSPKIEVSHKNHTKSKTSILKSPQKSPKIELSRKNNTQQISKKRGKSAKSSTTCDVSDLVNPNKSLAPVDGLNLILPPPGQLRLSQLFKAVAKCTSMETAEFVSGPANNSFSYKQPCKESQTFEAYCPKSLRNSMSVVSQRKRKSLTDKLLESVSKSPKSRGKKIKFLDETNLASSTGSVRQVKGSLLNYQHASLSQSLPHSGSDANAFVTSDICHVSKNNFGSTSFDPVTSAQAGSTAYQTNSTSMYGQTTESISFAPISSSQIVSDFYSSLVASQHDSAHQYTNITSNLTPTGQTSMQLEDLWSGTGNMDDQIDDSKVLAVMGQLYQSLELVM